MATESDLYKTELYKTLALNDTIHDFGKGEDRGVDINNILTTILKEESYKKYTPFGTPTLFSKSPFEKNAETFILDKFDLIGIPGNVLDTQPFFIWEPDNDGTPVNIEIYKFTNSNSFDNYALKTDIDTIIKLSDINRDKILYTPSEIYPSIDTLSTVLIKDSTNKIKLPQNRLDNKNKFGQFIMKFYFYGDGKNNTIVHNSDATSGNLKCAFAQGFKDNVIGVIRDTTNYADSAVTTTTEYGKPCFTGAPPNPFEKDIGVGADIDLVNGELVLTKTDNQKNVYKLPSIFPKTNLDSNNEIWIFDNNLFTYDTFIIAFKAKPGDPWIPYKAPYNFSLEIYDVASTTRESRIQRILNDDVTSIGSANFYPDKTPEKKYSINGPSVVYLKNLIKNIHEEPTDLKLAFDVKPDTNCIILKGLLTSLDTYLDRNRNKIEDRKNILIKLLLDIKRCGDYEQVDAIKAIQLQNEGVKNTAGLQDILFTSVDRLCTLYSRFKKNNVMWVKGGEKLYTMYRQPYLYPSEDILKEINDKKILAQFKNKVKFIKEFLNEITKYNASGRASGDIDPNPFKITDPSNMGSIKTNIQEIFKNIYMAQNKLLENGVFIGNYDLDILIAEFNNIELALQNDSLFKIKDGTYIDVTINGKSEPKSNYINGFFDILNKNLYSLFKFKPIIEKFYDPIEEKITKQNLITLDMIDQNILNFLKKLNIDKNNFNIYYTNLNEIQEQFYKDGKSPNSLFTPPADQRSSRTGTSGTNSDKLTAYLNLKGLINMVKNIFSINDYKIPEVLEQNITYLNDYKIWDSLGKIAGDTPTKPESVNYLEIVKELSSKTKEALESIEQSIPQQINQGVTKETNKKKNKLIEKKERQKKKKTKEEEKRTKNKEKIINLLSISKETRTTKGSLLEGLKRKSIIISANSQRKSPRFSRGGNLIQTGGGEAETLLGELFFDMIYDETADIMNQIYSTYLPNELLQMLLLDFDINYDSFEEPTKLSNPLGGEVIVEPTVENDIDKDLSEIVSKVKTEIDNLIPESGEDFSKEEPLILDRETYIKNFFTDVSEYLKMNNNKIYEQFKRDYPASQVNIDYLYNNNISSLDSKGIEDYLFGDTFIKKDGDDITGIYKLLLDFNEVKVKENEDISNFIKEITCNPQIQDTVDNQLQIMKVQFLNSFTDLSNIDVSDYDDVSEKSRIVEKKDIVKKLFENIQQNPVAEPINQAEKNAFVCFMNIMSLLLNFDVDSGKINYKSDAGVDAGVIAYLNSDKSLHPKKMLEGITFKTPSSGLTRNLNNKQIRVIIFYYFSLLVNLYSDKDIVYFPDEKSINIKMTDIFKNEQGSRTVQNITAEQIGTDYRLINSFNTLCNNLNQPNCSEAGSPGLGGGARIKSKRNKKKNKRKTVKSKNRIYF
jgi:hypothetical protein